MTRFTLEFIQGLLPKRSAESHKYSNGYVFAYVGSSQYLGAASLACQGMMQVGAGGVYAYCERRSSDLLHNHLPEAVVLERESPLKYGRDDFLFKEALLKAKAMLIGPGLLPLSLSRFMRHEKHGDKPLTFSKLCAFLNHTRLPTVIDAEAINVIAASGVDHFIKEVPKEVREQCIFTPHMGEAKRLLGGMSDEALVQFVHKTKSVLYVKGFPGKLIAPSEAIFDLKTGHPVATTAGCGDVLSGIITGYLAQGLSPLNAAKVGIYVAGRASELYAQNFCPHTMLASNVIRMIPRVLKELYE